MATIYCAHDSYYGSNHARELAHRMKENDIAAIRTMAKDLAGFVKAGCVLVPIPNRYGFATNTLSLAKMIVRESKREAKIANVLKGCARASLYDCKKEGLRLDQSYFGFYLAAPLPSGKHIMLVDNVLASGLTATAALELVPSAHILVHSVARNAFEPSIHRQRFGEIVTPQKRPLELRQRHKPWIGL